MSSCVSIPELVSWVPSRWVCLLEFILSASLSVVELVGDPPPALRERHVSGRASALLLPEPGLPEPRRLHSHVPHLRPADRLRAVLVSAEGRGHASRFVSKEQCARVGNQSDSAKSF